MTKKQMTHEEHVALANVLYPAFMALQTSYIEVANKFGASHAAAKKLRATLQAFRGARALLDDEYHAVTPDGQYLADGHVYYNLRGTKGA